MPPFATFPFLSAPPLSRFADFVERIGRANANKSSPYGLTSRANPHWRPQRYMCNLDRFMGAYNFVGAYEHVSDHARALLAATARAPTAPGPPTTLWEEHGARGWGRRPSPFERRAARLKGQNASAAAGPSPDAVSFFEKNVAHHKTSSSSRSDRYFTEELLQRIRQAYWMDYEMIETLGLDVGTPLAATDTIGPPRKAAASSASTPPPVDGRAWDAREPKWTFWEDEDLAGWCAPQPEPPSAAAIAADAAHVLGRGCDDVCARAREAAAGRPDFDANGRVSKERAYGAYACCDRCCREHLPFAPKQHAPKHDVSPACTESRRRVQALKGKSYWF